SRLLELDPLGSRTRHGPTPRPRRHQGVLCDPRFPSAGYRLCEPHTNELMFPLCPPCGAPAPSALNLFLQLFDSCTLPLLDLAACSSPAPSILSPRSMTPPSKSSCAAPIPSPI